MLAKCKILLGLVSLSLQISGLFGQENTVGLISSNTDDDGYVLFTPISNRTTYLINRQGEEVHRWVSQYVPGMTTYLREDGSLFRAGRVTEDTYINSGGAGGIIEQFNWNGDVIWQYRYSSPQARQHHDFELLPNGNILLLAWEKKTESEAIAAGRDPASLGTNQLWPDHLIEIKPDGSFGGEVVWEWHVWDHMVQNFDQKMANYGDVNNPELININHYQNRLADWIHGNSIEYNAHLDQIMLSSRGFNELWIIDHSTTTEQAKTKSGGRSGKGGSLLWRWGNPNSYQQNQKQFLFGQHGAHWEWSDASSYSRIYVYNNGNGRKPSIYSTIESLEINYGGTGSYPLLSNGQFAPIDFLHSFIPKDSLAIYAPLFSNVIKLEKQHLLTCVGPRGTFIEFDENGQEVWKYVNPVSESGRVLQQGESIGNHQASINSVFSIQYYRSDFDGLKGKDLSAKGKIEDEQITSTVAFVDAIRIFPNPASDYLRISGPVNLITIFDAQGIKVLSEKNPGDELDVRFLKEGLYYGILDNANTFKLIILR